MSIEEEPRNIVDLAACEFQHAMDLPTYGHQPGVWDLLGRFDDYTARIPFANQTVLDVGTATGFLTFEAERRGGKVTSFDASGADKLHELPIRGAEFVRDSRRWPQTLAWLEGLKNSYWLCHRDLGSQARCVYGDVYDLNPNFGVFDVVLIGQVLIHLPDGLSALAAAASVCGTTIVIVEGSFDNESPIAALSGRANRPDVAYAWYQYSHGWYREVLTMLGFSDIAITTDTYSCHHDHHRNEIELATIVGRRSG